MCGRRHCQALHNPSSRERVAVVTRWAPWWLSINEFGSAVGTDGKSHGRVPLTTQEWEALPPAVQPLFRHLAVGVKDELQALNIQRSRDSDAVVKRGRYDPGGESNAHVVFAPRL